MRWQCIPLMITLLAAACTAQAQLTSPQIGWEAEFNGIFHNVGGRVTILDEDTLQFDNFTYDGQGIDVFFYLGAFDSYAAFVAGEAIGEQLVGTSFDGTQPAFTIDLPEGLTMEGFHAISVWCVDVPVNFGSGSFTYSADFDVDFDVDGDDLTDPFDGWETRFGVDLDGIDFLKWQQQFGSGVVPLAGAPSVSVQTVPEPATCALLVGLAASGLLVRRRSSAPETIQ